MSDIKPEQNAEETVEVVPETAAPEVAAAPAAAAAPARNDRPPRRDFTKNKKPGRGREVRERAKPEFDQKMVQIRRVTRVTSGGRRMAFSVAMIIGNRKGQVGMGTGKGIDTQIAIEKALRSAKKNMVTIPLTKDNSIPHDVVNKYSSAIVSIQPAPSRGLVAGSAVRHVLELAGITNVNAKILSPSKNKLNIAKATIEALSMLKAKKPKVVSTN
jgi:small subunit ribosomal protein S5